MAKSRASSTGELNGSPSHLLHRVLQLALDLYADESGEAAVTQRQYAVLSAVAADEGLSQTGLVRATGIDRSTLADVVARMMAKDLLVRERSASDARANTVRLTEQGRLALQAARSRVLAADARLLALLGPKKRDPFVDALRRISRSAEAALTPDMKAPEVKARDAEAAEIEVEGSADADASTKPRKGKKDGKLGKKKRRALKAQAYLPAEAQADPAKEADSSDLNLDVDEGSGT